MSNDYYTRTNVTRQTLARAATVNDQLAAIETGFERLPSRLALSQDRVTYAADSGTANAYVVTLSPAPVAYVIGMRISMKAAAANTGAATINVNGLGARAIRRVDGSDLSAGDIPAGAIVAVQYDGSKFQLVSSAGGDLAAAAAAVAAAPVPYASRAVAAATSIPAVVKRIAVIQGDVVLGYLRNNSTGTLTTADGQTWSPDTPFLLLEHFGGVADWNGTTGTDNAAAVTALCAYVNAGLFAGSSTQIILRGRYYTTAPMVITHFGVTIEAGKTFQAGLYGGHTSGPVLHIRKGQALVRGINIGANSTRAAASFDNLSCGILVGDFDWEDPTAYQSASASFFVIEQCTVVDQPGDGILCFGGGGDILNNTLNDNKGHGCRVDMGGTIGVTAASLGYPGWTTIKDNQIWNNGGHSVCMWDGDTTPSDVTYRYEVKNNDCLGNATDAAVRYVTEDMCLVAAGLETELNAIAGENTRGGMYVAGRQHTHRNNRFIQVADCAYNIDDLTGYQTRGITIDRFTLESVSPSLDPAIKIASTITASRGVRVTQDDTTAITKLVADADRGKLAQFNYGVDNGFQSAVAFTPTFTFATAGDLSVTYGSNNKASYTRIAPGLAFVQIYLEFTPTFTTASGVALIGGMPLSMDADLNDRLNVSVPYTSRMTWNSATTLSLRPNSATVFRIVGAASGGTSEIVIEAAQFSSGFLHVVKAEGLVKLA